MVDSSLRVYGFFHYSIDAVFRVSMLHGGDVNDSAVLMFPPLIYMSTIILLKY
jgi:hypothetical protein